WRSFLAVAVLLPVRTQEMASGTGGPASVKAVEVSGGQRGRTAGPPSRSGSIRYAPPAGHRRERGLRGPQLAARVQWPGTCALAPPLAWTFHEVSLVSPLANAYAIPAIELLVTPLSLLRAALALVPGLDFLAGGVAWLAHGALAWMMVPTE